MNERQAEQAQGPRDEQRSAPPSRDQPTDDQLSALLQIAPFHHWLGLKLLDRSEDQLTIGMPWRDEIVSNTKLPAVHGGIISSLIDLTGLYSILAVGGIARATADLHIDFHRPATPGLLRAVGRPVKLGRQISVAEVKVIDEGERLLASGRGAYVGG